MMISGYGGVEDAGSAEGLDQVVQRSEGCHTTPSELLSPGHLPSILKFEKNHQQMLLSLEWTRNRSGAKSYLRLRQMTKETMKVL
jgi:hypothetical protein